MEDFKTSINETVLSVVGKVNDLQAQIEELKEQAAKAVVPFSRKKLPAELSVSFR